MRNAQSQVTTDFSTLESTVHTKINKERNQKVRKSEIKKTKKHFLSGNASYNKEKSIISPEERAPSFRSSSLRIIQTHPGSKIPSSPPKPIILAPPFVAVEKHPNVDPEKIIIDHNAGTVITPLAQNKGWQLTYKMNVIALTEEAVKKLNQIAVALSKKTSIRVVLKSYAVLPGEDMSMPRRISLDRSMMIRSIFITQGNAATRIYPQSYGRPPKDDKGPYDRVDIILDENPAPEITPITGEAIDDNMPYDPLLSPVRYHGRIKKK